MSIIIRIITGVLQDNDNNSYDHVVIVYVILASGSVLVATILSIGSLWTVDLGHLQWTRKQGITKGDIINERKEAFEFGPQGQRNKKTSMSLFVAMTIFVLGA